MSARISYPPSIYLGISDPLPNPFISPDAPPIPIAPEQADLWVAEGPNDIQIYGGTAYERDTPVNFTESSTFITPTVEIVTLTYRLSR
jgi:hypothetical protein